MGLFGSVLEVFMPTQCGGCDIPGTLLCDACLQALPRVERRWACLRCGAPFGYLTCTECGSSEPAYEAGVCAGTLEQPLSRCVTLFKDGGERRLARPLGMILGQAVAEWSGWIQAVVPVPTSVPTIRRRGFDHTGLLAESVAATLGVPAVRALLCTGARDQRELGRGERIVNVSAAFVLRSEVALPPRVLCVDDVMTTGSTLDAATAALLLGGAEAVRVGAVARAW